MKSKIPKRLLSSLLSVALSASICTPAMILADDTDTVTEASVSDSTSSSSSQSTYATLTAEALMFNIEVPTSIPIDVSSAGVVSVGDNFTITNNSVGPIEVVDLSVSSLNSWSIKDYDTNFSQEKVDTKAYGIKFFDDEASAGGGDADGIVSIALTSSDWTIIYGKDELTSDDELTITYDANVAAQANDIDATNIGLVQITLDWYRYSNYSPTISGAVSKTIECDSVFDPLEGITATDYLGNDITDNITYMGSVDTSVPDDYEIIYKVTDPESGEFTSVTITITVGSADTISDYLTLTSNSVFTLATTNETGTEFYDWDEELDYFGDTQDTEDCVGWDGYLYYSIDTETWIEWDGTSINSSDTGTLYLAGEDNTKITGSVDNYRWSFTDAENLKITGNIETLLDWETVANGKHPEMASYCFSYLFYNCTSLVESPELPATTLTSGSYNSMFNGCTALTEAPSLPATILADSCYQEMFSGCTSLVESPELPATELASYCYISMFAGCTSLTEASSLPATTLTSSSYNSMFNGCTALTEAPALPATTLADSCYNGMFAGCTRLTEAPALPATTLEFFCYNSMFSGCTSLATAPSLPAETLASYCYQFMFYNCTSLTTVPELPATTLVDSCYSYMFSGCSSLMVSETTDDNYQYAWRIPTAGTGSEGTSYLKNMLADTGGTFTGTPSINTTYYVMYEPISSSVDES